jgi:hypothetical protein
MERLRVLSILVGLTLILAGACSSSEEDALDRRGEADAATADQTSPPVDGSSLINDTGRGDEDVTVLPPGDISEPPPDNTVVEPHEFNEAASFLSHVALAGVGNEPACCFDFNGDGAMDNVLGEFAASTESLVGEVGATNFIMDEMILGGEYAPIIEYVGLDSVTDDGSITLHTYLGLDSDGDLADNLAGTGEFGVKAKGLGANGATPQATLKGRIEAGTLSVKGTGTRVLVPVLPVIWVELPLDEVHIEAPVTIGANGLGLATGAGKLGGIISLESFAGAMNEHFDEHCDCLAVEEPLAAVEEGKLVFTQVPNEFVTCDEEDDTELACYYANKYMAMLSPFLKPDVDWNEDGVDEALSIGFSFHMVSTHIAGISGGCVPHCEGQECGSDGCGGSCGNCADGTACSEGACVQSEGGECCEAHDLPDCDEADCSWCVCGIDSLCCVNSWTSECVEAAILFCEEDCPCGGVAECEPPCQDGLSCQDGECVGSKTCSEAYFCLVGCPYGDYECSEACEASALGEESINLQSFLNCQWNCQPDISAEACLFGVCFEEYHACLIVGTGTDSCMDIVNCASACMDADCMLACYAQGTMDASQKMLLAQVCFANECGPNPTEGCLQAVVSPGGPCVGVWSDCVQ